MTQVKITVSKHSECSSIIGEHMKSLYSPLDSWLEEALLTSGIYRFDLDGSLIGYCCIKEEILKFFYIKKQFFAYASDILERVADEFCIKKIMVTTQDSALCALMGEWDYEIKRNAWIFCDSGRETEGTTKTEGTVFRKAEAKDCGRLKDIAGDFFDEASCGYASLEERIADDTIFVLEQKDGQMLGGGILEYGRICTGYASIGMITNPEHRQKGVARTILINLKDYVYSTGKKPVAGCWYYNTLSRKSLESAGMIVASFVYEAELIKKDKPPKRTGNPPGELVE